MTSADWLGLIIGITTFFTATMGLAGKIILGQRQDYQALQERFDALNSKVIDRAIPALENGATAINGIREVLARTVSALDVDENRRRR